MENFTYFELDTLSKSLDQTISNLNHRGMVKEMEEIIELKKKVLRIMSNESIRLEILSSLKEE